MTQRKTKKKEEPTQVEVQTALDTVKGRYCNHIQIVCQEEEFDLDFLLRTGDKTVHVNRIMLSPPHVERFVSALKRQLAMHRKTFYTSLGKTSQRSKKKR